MSLRITFDLNDDDLKHFEMIMRQARKAAACMAPEDILAAAEEVLQDIDGAAAPGFVRERIAKLKRLIAMLSDLEWRLPHQEAGRVLNALAYFTEPEDLIPDDIPGLGFLDDAIMIELIARELKHEIEAYQDFCDYRTRKRSEGGRQTRVSREDWLESRRSELQTRMRRRKRSERPGRGHSGLFK
jgi:uncharacterized membrane protein YkvA (DUF1232 family)